MAESTSAARGRVLQREGGNEGCSSGRRPEPCCGQEVALARKRRRTATIDRQVTITMAKSTQVRPAIDRPRRGGDREGGSLTEMMTTTTMKMVSAESMRVM